MASWATQGTVSQAAALALRQLQDQLGAAYLENTKLQDEAARDRAEALQIAQAQHKELEQSETANAAVKDQLSEMKGLLQVLLALLWLMLVLLQRHWLLLQFHSLLLVPLCHNSFWLLTECLSQ